MKKLAFMFVAMAALSFAACTETKAPEAPEVSEDVTAVDSAAAVVDSAAAAAGEAVEAAADAAADAAEAAAN